MGLRGFGLSGWLRRLEREGAGDDYAIPQKDGSVARFPRSAGLEAYQNLMDRMGAGEDAPEEHPLITAARNSDSPEWSKTFFAVNDEGFTDPIEDLSE